NGPIAGLTVVNGDEDIMLITDKGVMIRFEVQSVSQTGRATLGVRLIKVDDDSIVSTMAKIAEDESDSDDDSDSDNNNNDHPEDSTAETTEPSDGDTATTDSDTNETDNN